MAVMSRRKKSIVGLMVVGVLCGVIGMVGRASALTYQDTQNVEFTFNPTMNISLSDNALVVSNLMPGSSSDSNLLTIDISTNSGYGYYLAATVGTSTQTTDLVNVENSDYTFQNLSSNVASLVNFPDNKWGYSYSTDGGTNWVSGDAGATNAGYAGLPLDNDDSGATGVKLLDVGSFVGSSSVKFKIAAKASATQASGTYTNTVNFYAVANPKPEPPTQSSCSDSPMISTVASGITYMQDINSTNSATVLSALTTDATYQIKDNRDNETYCVGKLADGKLWLLDNLALDLTSSTVLSAMNENNTHASNIALGYLKGNTIRDPAVDANGQYATAAVSDWISSASYSAPLVNLTDKDIIPSDTISTNGGYKIGGYYNYCAASAGSYCYGDGASYGTPSGNATSDICPKGWRMPTGSSSGDYASLAYIIYGSTDSTSDATAYADYRNALHISLTGYFFDGTVRDRNYARIWSSTYSNAQRMYHIYLRNSYANQTAGLRRDEGISVRCVLGS